MNATASPSPSPAANAAPLLSVHDIHKRFGQNEVLKGVSLEARAGDVISLIGSSGSGKSTLLRCINLLEKPNAGRIVLGGEEMRLKADKHGELQAAFCMGGEDSHIGAQVALADGSAVAGSLTLRQPETWQYQGVQGVVSLNLASSEGTRLTSGT